MESQPSVCPLRHVDASLVRTIQSFRARLRDAEAEIARAHARLSYACDQVDSLQRELERAL